MKTFNDINKSIIQFWQINGITEKDLYCRKCNKLMIDIDELDNVDVIYSRKNAFFRINKSRKQYTESPQNKWCIKGRTLSEKTYFRHLCWDCLKKEMIYTIEHNDELNIISPSRFPIWKRMLMNGKIQKYFDKFPPPGSNSPIWWFRLIFDMTEEELNVERKKFDTASIESFIKRYGEEEGRKKYNEYVNLQSKVGCSLDYFIEKYGKEAGKAKYDEVCLNKGVSKKNCIKKYGKDIGNKFFKQYCDKQAKVGNTLDYFIEKYDEKAGIEKYNIVCHQKSITLANFIHKYGQEEGIQKYKEYSKRLNTGYSNISQQLFIKIDDALGQYANNSFFFIKNYETEVEIEIDGKKKTAKLDYELNKKVIEFNGDYWHANPKIYAADEVVKYHLIKKTASDVWNRDAQRIAAIEKCGFKVHIVWESDYENDPERIINECVDFLKGKLDE